MAENTNLIETFMSKLSERNAMSIAANAKYNSWQAEEKLINKFGFSNVSQEGRVKIDGETFYLYRIDNQFYAKDDTGTFWNVDSRVIEKEVPEMKDDWAYTPEGDKDWMGVYPTGRMTTKLVTEYQLNSTVTDPKILEFFKAFEYLNSDDRKEYMHKVKADKKATVDKDIEQARRIIRVEVTDGKFTDPNDYVDDINDENWAHEDDEAEFNIKIIIGSTPVFEGLALASVNWDGSSETTYYRSARMYMRNGDPGYPEESSGVTRVNFDNVDLTLLEDTEGNQYETDELAVRVPEGKFRDMFVKYGKQVIESALEDYVDSHSDEVEYEW